MLQQNVIYGCFSNIIEGYPLTIKISDITKETRFDYIEGLKNLFKDAIETEIVQKSFIKFVFDNGFDISLSLPDSLINFCMWGFILETDEKIQPKHVFFPKDGITKKDIAAYIDEFCIIPNREKMDSAKLNDIVYRVHRSLAFVNDFSMFFNNSISLEDFIDMADACPEFDALMHKDYSGYPANEMNQEAMKDTNRLIELILQSKKIMGREHGLIDAFRAKVGIKPKQFREAVTNVGVKPNGEGGIFPYSIDGSYINGSINTIAAMVSDSGIGRQAQILSKKNTADSGAFARILGLNSLDTNLYTDPRTHKIDPTYDCHTKNYIKRYVENEKVLEMISDRFYRFDPKGMEYNTGVGKNLDKSLIGKTIYLRSPATCASAAKGLGICRHCYGNLFEINDIVNIGKIAAEEFSSRLTQLMLSAKHLLEAKIRALVWIMKNINNEEAEYEFDDFFVIDDEFLTINPELVVNKKWFIQIDKDNITLETATLNDGDEDSGDDVIEVDREYLSEFNIITDTGDVINIHSDQYENLYITSEFAKYIHMKRYTTDESNIVNVPINEIQSNGISMFTVTIANDDLSKSLRHIMNILNLTAITTKFTKDEIVTEMQNKMIECSLNEIRSVHAEVLIMNQIKDPEDILCSPDWDYPNAPYQILTLRNALTNNPSVLISMQFDNIAKTLYMPITYKKKKASKIDLWYHTQPQQFIKQDLPNENDNRINQFTHVDRKK
jgi:hypothetical protein